MVNDESERTMQQQPIIGFVVDNDEPVVKCVGCTAKEDNCVDKIRDGEDYGTTIPYPECNGCGEVLRPNSQIDTDTSDASDTESSQSTDELEAEAREIIDTFNTTKASHSPKLELFTMSDYDNGEYVFWATGLIDRDGLSAVRERGHTVEYINGTKRDGDVMIMIHVPVQEAEYNPDAVIPDDIEVVDIEY